MTADKPLFTKLSGADLLLHGTRMYRKRNPVFVKKIGVDFDVEVGGHSFEGSAGDYVAHDVVTGDIFIVSASKLEQEYEQGEN